MTIANVPVIGKVLLILSLLGLFTMGATVFSARQMAAIDQGYRSAITHEGTAAINLTRANRAFAQMGAAIANLLISTTMEGNVRAEADFTQARKDFLDRLSLATAALPSRAAEIEALHGRALAVVDRSCARTLQLARAATAAADIAVSQQEYLNSCGGELAPVKEALSSLSRTLIDEQVAESARLSEVSHSTIVTTYAAVSAGLALVFAAAFFAVKGWISTPLKHMAGRMEQLAGGDLSVDVDGQARRDEVGLMARAVQVFKDNALRTRVLETEAAEARALAETEAGRTEALRRQIEAEQKFVVASLAEGLSGIAEGDLTRRLDKPFPDDYRQLQDDFNAAVAKLAEALSAVAGSVGGMKSQTDEISTASDDMSRRTEQQAAALEETAAALNEITNAVRKTADSARQAADVTASARLGAEKSGAVVRQAVEAMGQIEQSSDKIGKIIGVIDEIAFQTNLLALNAGVEAARAGEAGRGFAVVAQEVRGLAQRSAEAAKEIKELISASTSQVERGVDLVGQTGTALDRMVEQVAELTALVTGIASSAKEQATGLNEVNAAVNQMDQVTQQNAAMVEQSTAANRALAAEAVELQTLMAQFRTGEATSRRPAPASRRPAAQHARNSGGGHSGAGHSGGGAQRKLQLVASSDEWAEF